MNCWKSSISGRVNLSLTKISDLKSFDIISFYFSFGMIISWIVKVNLRSFDVIPLYFQVQICYKFYRHVIFNFFKIYYRVFGDVSPEFVY